MTRIWGELVGDSLIRPRVAARRVMALRINPLELLMVAVIITCAGIIMAFVATRASSGGLDPVTSRVLNTPLFGAGIELAVMAVIAVLTHRIGVLFGGKGAFLDAVALVVWLNVMLLLIQIAQILALATFPPVAAALSIVGILWAFWAFANFVTELHGFENPFMVLGAVVLTAIVLFIAVAMLLAILGLTPPEVG